MSYQTHYNSPGLRTTPTTASTDVRSRSKQPNTLGSSTSLPIRDIRDPRAENLQIRLRWKQPHGGSHLMVAQTNRHNPESTSAFKNPKDLRAARPCILSATKS
ncbi:unnamed protein product [Arabidopsis halleri]